MHFWSPYSKDTTALENVQRRATAGSKVSAHGVCEEPGLFGTGKRQLGITEQSSAQLGEVGEAEITAITQRGDSAQQRSLPEAAANATWFRSKTRQIHGKKAINTY